MNRLILLACGALVGLIACSDSDGERGDDTQSSSSSSSGDLSSSSSGSTSDDAGASSSSSSSSSGSSSDECNAARTDALQEQTTVSAGAVTIVRGAAGAEYELYVDAHAGGAGPSATQPRVYVDLATGARVDVSDVAARTDLTWDLAIKRTNVHSNSGVAADGQGGAQAITKPFAEVTAADATAIAEEDFFTADCELKMKQHPGLGADPYTYESALSGWYSYDLNGGHAVAPVDQTYIVRGGDGALFKVHFESYTATPTGGTDGETTGRFLLRVAPLQ